MAQIVIVAGVVLLGAVVWAFTPARGAAGRFVRNRGMIVDEATMAKLVAHLSRTRRWVACGILIGAVVSAMLSPPGRVNIGLAWLFAGWFAAVVLRETAVAAEPGTPGVAPGPLWVLLSPLAVAAVVIAATVTTLTLPGTTGAPIRAYSGLGLLCAAVSGLVMLSVVRRAASRPPEAFSATRSRSVSTQATRGCPTR